jgi:hypothetical protein
MKSIFIILTLLAVSTSGIFAQSKSYSMLRKKFSGMEGVFSIHTTGFMTRTILWMAAEPEYDDAIRSIRNVRLTVVPKEAFRKQKVTLSGFRKMACKDGFEELIHVQDHGEDVTILQQAPARKHHDNRYLILVDEPDEAVVIEVTGYIDPDVLLKHRKTIFL